MRFANVGEAVTRPLLAISAYAHVGEVRSVMDALSVPHALIGDSSHPLGVISRSDVDGIEAECIVGEYAHLAVPVIAASAALERAARLLRRCRAACLPVVVGRRVVSLVTAADLKETRS